MGLHFYPYNNALEGFFMGGGLIGGYAFVDEGSEISNGVLLGLAIRFGYRWIWNHFSIAPNASIRYTVVRFDTPPPGTRIPGVIIDGTRSRIGLGLALAF